MKPTKPCPICYEAMTIKPGAQTQGNDKPPLYSIYCRACGYGLQEAFNSRINCLEIHKPSQSC